jgi:hypothetical protein
MPYIRKKIFSLIFLTDQKQMLDVEIENSIIKIIYFNVLNRLKAIRYRLTFFGLTPIFTP